MRNPTYEQALANQGVKWEYVEKFDMAEIDYQKGLQNQARLEMPLDDDLVNAYALRMKDGDQFPPIVLWRPGKGRWIPVDGNHNLAAKRKNNWKRTDAYLLDTKDQQVADRLTWTFNNSVNGRRLTPAEAMEHALSFVRKYGLPLTEAAKEWGVNVHNLQRHVKTAEIRDILNKNNVRINPAMADHCLFALSPLQNLGEDVLVKAGKLVSNSGITSEVVKTLVDRVQAARDSTKKLKAIDDFAESEAVRIRRAVTKGGRLRQAAGPRMQLLRHLSALQHLFEDYKERSALRPQGQAEYASTRDMAQDVVTRLVSLFGLGVPPKQQEAV